MTKQLIYSTLAGTVVFFLGGWLIYGILLAGFYETQSIAPAGFTKDPESASLAGLLIANFVYALLLAVVFTRWANISTFQTGATAGAIISFLVSLSMNLGYFSMNNYMTATGYVVDTLTWTLFSGLVGGVMGWVLGKTPT